MKSVDYSKIILYADDIVVLNKNKDLSILKWQIENDLENTCKWLLKNRLKLNFPKTKQMTFSTCSNTEINIKIDNSIIENVDEFKYLGLLIDKELKFKNHILNITSKINSSNYITLSTKAFLTRILASKTLFFPSLLSFKFTYHFMGWKYAICAQPTKSGQ